MAYTLSLYDRAGVWYARVYLEGDGGADRRFSTGVKVGDRPRVSKVEAQAVAKKRADAFAPNPKVTGERDSLQAVADRLLRQKHVDGRRDLAVYAYAFNLDKHVLPFFGAGRSVGSIRRADLESFKAHMAVSYEPTTINNALTAIRQVLKHAAFVDELIESVPAVRNVVVDKQGAGRALTKEETAKLLGAVVDEEAREWLTFVANTGLRRTEALAIRWSWIDWRNKTLSVPAQYRKGGKPQKAPTPLNGTVLRLLRSRQRRREQPSDDRVWWQKKHQHYDRERNQAAEAVKLGRVRSHDLRHTAGSRAHAGGAEAPVVRDLLGHSTMAMVSRYGHSYGDRLAKAAKMIEVAPAVTGAVPGERVSRGGNMQERARRGLKGWRR